jgi:hypothetical protein
VKGDSPTMFLLLRVITGWSGHAPSSWVMGVFDNPAAARHALDGLYDLAWQWNTFSDVIRATDPEDDAVEYFVLPFPLNEVKW